MFGVPLRERVRRTVETVEILRRAWTGERFSFDGRVYSFDQVQVTPRPERPDGAVVPIWLGGMADAAIRRAGRLGDGYLRTRGGNVDSMREDAAAVDAAAREAGRSVELPFGQLQNVFVWEDSDAWEVVREGAQRHLGVYGGWAAGGDTPEKGYLSEPPDDATLQFLTPSGRPEEVVRKLRPMIEAFGSRRDFHLVVRLQYPGMPFETSARAMELFASKVIPALRPA